MTDISYQISGLEDLTKPGTYTIHVGAVLPDPDGGLSVYGHVVTPPTADDDVVERTAVLDGLLMRPFFVLRSGRAKSLSRGLSEPMKRGGATAAARAAAEIDRIVRAYVKEIGQ